jgi:hypothetical protein
MSQENVVGSLVLPREPSQPYESLERDAHEKQTQ